MMGDTRYIVARSPNAGIGDHVSGVLGAWWYAKNTGRSLIIDWRGSRFNEDPSRNCFFDYFEEVDEIDGVPVHAGDDVWKLYDQGPFYYPKWSTENVRTPDHVSHTSDEVSSIRALIETCEDRPEPVVIANQHLLLPSRPEAFAKALGSLRFAARYEAQADRFCTEQLGNNPFVAVHIRHGNGENIGTRAAYWLDPIDLLRQFRQDRTVDVHSKAEGIGGQFQDNRPPSLTAVRRNTRAERGVYDAVSEQFGRLARTIGEGTKLVLFTDAQQVVDGIRARIPEMKRYEAAMLPQGSGPLHQKTSDSNQPGVSASRRTDDMFTELAILNRCSGLVCVPSQFTVMKRTSLRPAMIRKLEAPRLNRLIVRLEKRRKRH